MAQGVARWRSNRGGRGETHQVWVAEAAVRALTLNPGCEVQRGSVISGRAILIGDSLGEQTGNSVAAL